MYRLRMFDLVLLAAFAGSARAGAHTLAIDFECVRGGAAAVR